MEATNNTTPDLSQVSLSGASEEIEQNPVLAAARIFAGDTLFEEVIKEIKKERERQNRRERRGLAK